MPKRSVVSCVDGDWVRLTDSLVISATFQNQSSGAVRIEATIDAVGPVGETGLVYAPFKGEGSGRALSDLFPGLIGVGASCHLWALGPGGAHVWIEHE